MQDEAESEARGVLCVHHWHIEKPIGELSNGVCLLCGDARDFRNSRPEGGYRYRTLAVSPKKRLGVYPPLDANIVSPGPPELSINPE